MTRHYPDLGSTCDWSCRVGNLFQPIRSTIQNWVVMRHQYGISALVRRHLAGKLVVASPNVGCFPRLAIFGTEVNAHCRLKMAVLSPVSTYQFSRPFSIHFLTFGSFYLVHVRCQQWSAGCDGFNVGRRVHEACTYPGTTP